jgi:hypothetical protein
MVIVRDMDVEKIYGEWSPSLIGFVIIFSQTPIPIYSN